MHDFGEILAENRNRNIKESGYYDLVAMQLAHGHSVSLIEGGDI